MQIALLADFVAISTTTTFWLPNVGLAHNTDHGETYTLPRKVGIARAMQIALLGERTNANDAERFGIANWVVPDDELDEKGLSVARALARAPAVAVKAMKSLLKGSASAALDVQLVAEREALRSCAATDDFVEANRAFSEKRKPVFRGR
jgi:2-(1,2-epoxy-1,2-dihydrophenyl)acetyl-CoA isomerase